MENFNELIITMGGFALTHFAFSSDPLRKPLAKMMGAKGFSIFYSIVSLVLLFWAVSAYIDAPHVELWPFSTAAGIFSVVIMLPACILIVPGYLTPNPVSIIGAKHVLEPAQGITKITRHPVMWGFGFWAMAHLAANGDVASVVFFGLFLLVAIGGAAHLEFRTRKRLGEKYDTLCKESSFVPFVAIITGRTSASVGEIGWLQVLGGVVLYGVLLVAHGAVIGPDLLSRF